jgi:hypothetical protein
LGNNILDSPGPEFDAAIRKIVKVPKDEIERREQANKIGKKKAW